MKLIIKKEDWRDCDNYKRYNKLTDSQFAWQLLRRKNIYCKAWEDAPPFDKDIPYKNVNPLLLPIKRMANPFISNADFEPEWNSSPLNTISAATFDVRKLKSELERSKKSIYDLYASENNSFYAYISCKDDLNKQLRNIADYYEYLSNFSESKRNKLRKISPKKTPLENKFIIRKQMTKNSDLWPQYLQILDAKLEKISDRKIGKTIFKDDKLGGELIGEHKKTLEAARDHYYIFLP